MVPYSQNKKGFVSNECLVLGHIGHFCQELGQ